MIRKIVVLLTVAALLPAAVAFAESLPTAAERSNEEIYRILVDRIDTYHRGVGVVVGIIDPKGRRIIAHGSRTPGDPRGIDGATLFEIGSITKVFTALLLADMVQRGEVTLSDPVAKYLPLGVKVPEWNAEPITLQHLAMHVSGLPRMPMNFRPRNDKDTFADYTVDALYQFLSSYELRRYVGSQYEYSNVATGLLGHVLARRAGMDFEELVRTRITGPLGLTSTGIALLQGTENRLAPGHDEHLERVPNWHATALAGAGALRSSTSDLLDFLAVQMGLETSPLVEAIAIMRSIRGPRGRVNREMALGWLVSKVGGGEFLWHSGGTGGYSTFIGFDLKSRLGVVVLSNTVIPIEDIGLQLLTGVVPLAPQYKEVPIDSRLFNEYVGRYRLEDNKMTIAITREGNRLFAQQATQPKFGLFAKGDREFFSKISDTRIVFQPDARGLPGGIVFIQGDREQKGRWIMTMPRNPKEVGVDVKVLDRYVGHYRITPTFAITIVRDDDRLFAQATNQPPIRIYADSERHFFSKEADVQVTFLPDGENPAATLILHQNGYNRRASRVPAP
jgi:serine-type D-Ala-D-Ala carboxypeptidase/endopeptidase